MKGKGVSFMENVAGWHGKAPNYDEMVKALDELGLKETIAYDALLKKAKEYQMEVEAKLARQDAAASQRITGGTSGSQMKVKMEPTRKGFGKSLANNGDDERVVCLGLDISGSITISEFYTRQARAQESLDQHGHRRAVGHSGGRGTGARRQAAGLRHLCHVRRGTQSRPDSRLHLLWQLQRDDRRSARRRLRRAGRRDPPGAGRSVRHVRPAQHGRSSCPATAIETRKATDYLLLQHVGPKYIRFAREATPIVTRKTRRSSSARPT